MSYAKLTWENPDNNRYYEAHLDKDLFGWCLTKVWGRRGTKLGGMKHFPCETFAAGEILLEQIKKQRQRKHYQLTGCQIETDDGARMKIT